VNSHTTGTRIMDIDYVEPAPTFCPHTCLHPVNSSISCKGQIYILNHTPPPPQKIFPPHFYDYQILKEHPVTSFHFLHLPQILPSCSCHYLHDPKKAFSSTPLQYRQELSLLVSIMLHSLTNHTITSCMLSTAMSTWGSPSNPQFHSSWWCQLRQKVAIS